MDKLSEFLAGQDVIVGDGAMGTMLHAAGLPSGVSPEEWNVSHPEVLLSIYQAYVDAGSQVIESNTFGGNRFRLSRHGLQDRVGELNHAGVALARKVADDAAERLGRRVLVAGSMGPTGEILTPLGSLDPVEARAAYAEQGAALADGGADFVLIETMSALDEVEVAVEAVRSVCDLAIGVTMTFDTNFRTMMGVRPVQAVKKLHELGIRLIGANCGNGPGEIERVIGEMAAVRPDDVFLMAQANAGLPKVDGEHVHYDGTPQVMAAYASRMKALGIRYVGACCGSTPAHIAAMHAVLA